MSFYFFFYCSGAPRDLHSFPTRRSSDLSERVKEYREKLVEAAAETDDDLLNRYLEEGSLGEPEMLRARSEEHTSELQSHHDLVCRLLLEKKKKNKTNNRYL